MRFFIIFLVTALCSALLLHFLPWWSTMAVAFLCTLLLSLSRASSFWATATGGGLCWGIVPLFRDIPNHHLLSTKIAGVMNLPSWFFLLLVTMLVGLITAGLGGWAGASIRLFFPGSPALPNATAPEDRAHPKEK